MEPFSVSTDLNLEDWKAYRRAAVAENKNAVSRWWPLLIAVIGGIAGFVVSASDFNVDGLSFFVGVSSGMALYFLTLRIHTRANEVRQRNAVFGAYRYEFDSAGFRCLRDGIDSKVQWRRIRQLTQDTDHLYLWLEQPAAFVIPVRDLPSGLGREEAVARFDAWKANSNETVNVSDSEANSHQGVLGQESVTARPEPKSENLFKTLLRLFSLRAASGASITGSDRSIIGLSVLTAGLWVMIDRIHTGPNAVFTIYNLPNLALIAIAVLTLSFVLSRTSRPSADFRRVLVVVLCFLPVAIVAYLLMSEYLTDSWQLIGPLCLLGYATLYSMRALSALTGQRQVAPPLLGLMLCAFFWLFNASSLDLDTTVWYDAKTSTDSADDWKSARDRAEVLLYDQRDRIDDAIDAIPQPAEKTPAFFFVGFAGVGEQKVFAEEIKLASKVVDERFSTGKRSLLLMNDRRDLDSYPLATTTGLHYALARLAEKMDPDDILFLALSSHGSSDPELSVSNTALPLNDMSGEDLAAALEDSGIKWRVIVISACHAGAFIKYLENPNTIIITAAAADRSSFGCADDRDLTYFGEAFYRDALPKSKSLTDAFNETKAAIAKREKEEGRTPSNPQAFFGEELQRRLEGR